MKRSPLKRNNTPLKRTPLKKSNPKTAKQKHNDRQIQKEEDVVFYSEIWNERNHRCELSREYLGNEIMTIFFHHLLPKEQYPEYRHCKWNIIQITPQIHHQIERNQYLLEEDVYDKFIELLNIAKEKAHLL